MKTLFSVLLLLAVSTSNAQTFYYGGAVGVGLGKTYSLKTGLPGMHVNDLYLSVPVGCIPFKTGFAGHLIAEIEPMGTAATNFMVGATAGLKQDISEHAGVHLLFGVTDLFLYSPRPMQVTQHFFPTVKARLWIGNFNIQASYVRADTEAGKGQYYAGVGVIGLWEKLN